MLLDLWKEISIEEKKSSPKRFLIFKHLSLSQRLEQGSSIRIEWILVLNASLECLWSMNLNQVNIMDLRDFRSLMSYMHLKKNQELVHIV